MNKTYNIAVLVGSLRKASINRKLAQALNIQAPSLYWHFNAKQALIDGMADALVENVARHCPSDQTWDEQVRHLALEFRQALLQRRDGARVFAGTSAEAA